MDSSQLTWVSYQRKQFDGVICHFFSAGNWEVVVAGSGGVGQMLHFCCLQTTNISVGKSRWVFEWKMYDSGMCVAPICHPEQGTRNKSNQNHA
jgi:hypothetical protein